MFLRLKMSNEEFQQKIKEHGSWISEKYLEEVLSKKLRKPVMVKDYSIQAGVPEGQNYFSILYKAAVTYTTMETPEHLNTQKVHLMIKELPADPGIRGFLEQMGAFEKETVIYNELFPLLRNILKEYFPSDGPPFVPDSYETTRPDTLVMEDIGFDGFKMINRLDQLDLEQATVTIRTIARFHAICCKIEHDNPVLIQKCSSIMHSEENRAGLRHFVEAITYLAKTMEQWPEHESMKDIIEKLYFIGKHNNWTKMGSAEMPNKIFNCLNHGDLWANNIMFKNNSNGGIHSVKLVDFQLSKYGSPVLDLEYFLLSSCKPDVIKCNFYELFSIYHKALMSDLKTIRVSINYSYKMLLEQLTESANYAIGVVAMIRAVVFAPEKGLDIDKAEDEDEVEEEHVFQCVFRSTKYRSTTAVVLRALNNIGLLDEAVRRMNVEDSVMPEKEIVPKEMEDPSTRELSAREHHMLARIKSSVVAMSEEYDEMIRSSGAWITKDYIEEVLSTKLKKHVTVTNYSISAAVPAGQNYLSILYRTQVNYTEENELEPLVHHIMIKGLPQSDDLKELVETVFDKEYKVYTELLPKAKRLIEDFFPASTPNIAPEGYETMRLGSIIMEDLSQDGYKMLPRIEQLDLQHAEAALRTLARWHALTIKIEQDSPNIILETTSRSFVKESRPALSAFVEEAPKALVLEMENWPNRDDLTVIINKLRQITPYLWEKMEAMEAPCETMNVANHGDFWMNNILFKHDEEGKIHSAKLIDFQLARYTSPVMDLQYFLFSSVRPHVLETDLFTLYDVYYESLISSLNVLNVQLNYPKEQLLEEFRDRATYAVIVVSSTLGFVLAPEGGVPGLVAEDDKGVFTNTYQTSNYQNAATIILKLFEKIGYLDDAISRTKLFVEECLRQELESDSDQELESTLPVNRVMSARDRHMLARLKSSVRGAFRRFLDI